MSSGRTHKTGSLGRADYRHVPYQGAITEDCEIVATFLLFWEVLRSANVDLRRRHYESVTVISVFVLMLPELSGVSPIATGRS